MQSATACLQGGGCCPEAPPLPGPCASVLPASRVCDGAQCPSRLLRPGRTFFYGADWENGLGWFEGFSVTALSIRAMVGKALFGGISGFQGALLCASLSLGP